MFVRQKRSRLVLVLLILGGILTASLFLASAFGAVNISLPDMVKMVLNKVPFFDFTTTWRAVDETIVFQIRLPGVVGAALMINTLVAVLLGGLIPLALKGAKQDPALASGPILTTVTDMFGFFLVLSFASGMLPLLA